MIVRERMKEERKKERTKFIIQHLYLFIPKDGVLVLARCDDRGGVLDGGLPEERVEPGGELCQSQETPRNVVSQIFCATQI